MQVFENGKDHDNLIDVIEELESLIPETAGCPSGCSACCGPQLLTDAEADRMGLDGSIWTGVDF